MAILRWTALCLLGAVSAAVLLLAWVGQSQSGLRWALKQMPNSVIVEQASGDLGEFRFARVLVDTDAGRLELSNGQLKWNIFDVLTKTVRINNLAVGDVAITLNTSPSKPASFEPWQGMDLPVNLIVENAQINNINILTAGSHRSEQIDIEHLELVASLQGQKLNIESMDARLASTYGAAGLRSLSTRGSIDLSAKANGKIALEQALSGVSKEQVWTATVLHQGTWSELDTTVRAGGQNAVELDFKLKDLLREKPNWTGTIVLHGGIPVALGGQAAELKQADLTSEGSWLIAQGLAGLQVEAQGKIGGSTAQYPVWQSNVDLAWQSGDLEIRELSFSDQRNDSTTHVQASGRITNVLAFMAADSGNGSVQLQGMWDNFKWPLNATEPQLNLDGQFKAVGDTQDYTVELDTSGSYLGQTVTAQAEVNLGADRVTIKKGQLRSGPNGFDISGEIDKQVSLDWNITAPQISHFIDAANGELSGSGQLRGPRAAPQANAKFLAQNLEYQGHLIKDLSLQLEMPVPVDGEFSQSQLTQKLALVVSTRNAQLKSIPVLLNGRLNVSGTLASHSANIGGELLRGTSFAADITGGASEQKWNGQLSSITVDDVVHGQWKQVKDSTAIASSSALLLSPLCMRQSKQTICFEVDQSSSNNAGVSSPQTQAQLKVDQLSLSILKPILGAQDIDVLGEVNGTATYTLNNQQSHPLINIDMSSLGAQLSWQELDADVIDRETLDIQSIAFTLNQEQSLNAKAEIMLANGDSVLAQVNTIRPWGESGFAESPLSGRFTAQMSDLGQLPPSLLNDVSLEGQLDALVEWGGTVTAPTMSANAQLSQASAQIRALGLALKNINFTARSNNRAQVEFEGEVESGSGQLAVTGEVDLQTPSEPVLDLNVSGQNVQLANSTELQVNGDVALRAKIDPKVVDVSGKIKLVSAELDFDLPENAILASSDVVLEGEAKQKSTSQRRLDITVDLGDNTHIQAQGLDATLLGSLRVFQRLKGIVRGDGQIRVGRGRYVAYGQSLDIDTGTLIFDGGSIEDPNLEMRAQRVVGTTTAGVSVAGRASAPRLSLYSTPSLADQDILSVLMFGRTVNELGSQDALTLVRIANSLNNNEPSQFTKMTERLEDSLGLSNLELRLAGSDAGLTARKDLSSNISIGYGYGFLDAAQSLFLRYKISDRWSVKADVGIDSGADLRYQIEY